jgi:hypothetical protein
VPFCEQEARTARQVPFCEQEAHKVLVSGSRRAVELIRRCTQDLLSVFLRSAKKRRTCLGPKAAPSGLGPPEFRVKYAVLTPIMRSMFHTTVGLRLTALSSNVNRMYLNNESPMSRSWKNLEPVELTSSHPVQRSLSVLRTKLVSAENSSPGPSQESINPGVAERRGVSMALLFRSHSETSDVRSQRPRAAMGSDVRGRSGSKIAPYPTARLVGCGRKKLEITNSNTPETTPTSAMLKIG